MAAPHHSPHVPALYATTYMMAVEAARALGYALTIHGTLRRDLDLVAVPWTEEAASKEELLAAIQGIFPRVYDEARWEERAHGRQTVTITWEAGLYLDLSVMPRQAKA